MINSCYLIGEDSLLLQCATQLLTRNFKIISIISPIKSIQQWATSQDIIWVKSVDDLKITETLPIDYIFSIVNSQILSADFIKIARIAVINYHDSLLPDYAGLNATTWAILNGETHHGVTWHLMNERIDEGDILIQRSFPIEEDNTALTLNLRCYEQAVASFGELLDYLANNGSVKNPQKLQHRRYFSATHLLPDLGFINWQSMSGNDIMKMHKALVLGHYKNNVGRLKIYLNDDFLIVADVQIEVSQSIQQEPGTILKANQKELQVTTCSGEVVSLGFFAFEHQANPNFLTRYNLISGAQLPLLPKTLMRFHSENYRVALKQEKFWIKKLREISEHNTFSTHAIGDNKFYKLRYPLNWSVLFQNKTNTNHSILLLTALIVYFFRLNNYEKTSVFVVPKNLNLSQQQLPRLFPCFIPLSLSSAKASYSLVEMTEIIEEKYQDLLTHQGYLGDIYSRQPALEDNISSSITISFSPLEHRLLPNKTIIYIHIDEKLGLLSFYHRLNKNHHDGALLQLINCFNDHVTNIINQLVGKPQALVNQFCFLNDAERHEILQLGEGKSYTLPSNSLTTLFEKNVKCHPESPAILMNNQVISYLKLWQMAETIALALRQSVTPRTFVGIYTTRHPIMLAIILGILKADCIYVPLDPKYPLGKIDLVIKAARLSLIVTNSDYSKKLEQHFKKNVAISLLNAESLLDNSLLEHTFSVSAEGSQDELAYLMFTSGTTGVPKGVMITHKNVINYCYWFKQTTQFTEQSIIDFSSSIAFDLSIPCTIAPLLAGGAIAICSAEEKINPLLYLQHLQKHKVTHTELTPGYLELLLPHSDEIRKLNKTLKYLILGADILRASEVNKWLALCPSTQIVNEYGPTEATVSITSYFVQPQRFLHKSAVPIGQIAFNNYGYVIDKYNNLCPIGMKGELYVGGAQISLGYLGKLELTAEKFVTISLGDQEPMRLYKTGDEVCWLPDKQLQFFGRNDFQVKIHGYRIELSALEAILIQHPSIHQAIVILKQKAQEKYLCAYLIVSKSSLGLNELKNFLANQLPFYMIPKEFYLVDTIPLKENEKIDFDYLESQQQKKLLFTHTNTPNAMTLTEQYCFSIWQTVFNCSIQLEDNFFELGGDSLMALQIMTTLKNHYSLPLSLSLLFENPTIALLANKIDYLLANNSKKKAAQNLSNVLIKLSTGVYPVPIFLVHPVGGSIFWYQQLAQHLQGKYTIYGIQDPSIEGSEERFRSLEEMANFYLRIIEEVYQGESYCLGGASFGATVAFEMAYQLRQAGLSVEFLGLMDGWAHYPEVLMKENTLNLLTYSNQLLSKERYLQLVELEKYRIKLLLNYAIPVLNNDVVLFKAHDLWKVFFCCNDPFNGWRPYVQGDIAVKTIRGTHESMFFDPNVKQLAAIFFETLAKKEYHFS